MGLLLGLALSLIGAVGVGLAMLWGSFPVFVAAILVFGLGVGAGQQLRTAAADTYLPERRAEGLGYVLTGALLGALGGPLLIGAAQTVAGPLGLDSTALARLLVPPVLVPSMALVFLIKPDPKAIAADLERFYPGYRPPLCAEQDIVIANGASLRARLVHYPPRVAFLSNVRGTALTNLIGATGSAVDGRSSCNPAQRGESTNANRWTRQRFRATRARGRGPGQPYSAPLSRISSVRPQLHQSRRD